MENQNPIQPTQEVQNPTPPPVTEPVAEPEKSSFPKSKWLKIGIVVAVLVVLLGGVYILGKNNASKEVACTMEAKVCPDGSSVGRTGPKCEFTKCPVIAPGPTADWQTYTNTKYEFSIKVPRDWKIDRDETLELSPSFYSPCKDDIGEVCSTVLLGPGKEQISGSMKSNEITIKVAGENAQAYEVLDNSDENSVYYSLIYLINLKHNGIPFSISYDETLKGQKHKNSSDFRNKKIFDQMLSTFKFTQ